MEYYMAELQNANSLRKADKLESDMLGDALNEAENNKCFNETVLKVGTQLNNNGFLSDCVAVYENGIWSITGETPHTLIF